MCGQMACFLNCSVFNSLIGRLENDVMINLKLNTYQVRPTAQLNQQGAGYPVSAQYRGGVPPRGQPPVVRSMQSARPITGQQPMVPQGMPGRSMGMPSGGPVMPQPRPGFKFTPAMRNPPSQVGFS